MRIFLLIVLGYSLSYSSNLVVKDTDMKIEIQSHTYTLKKGQNLDVKVGETICFISGKGRIIIDDIRQLSEKSDPCFTIPVENSFDITHFASTVGNSIDTLFFDTTETLRNGTGLRGSTGKNKEYSLSLKMKKELIIYSDSDAPLPVTIKVFDKENNLVKKYENPDQAITLVRIPRDVLAPNSSIKISNGFNQIMLVIQVNQ